MSKRQPVPQRQRQPQPRPQPLVQLQRDASLQQPEAPLFAAPALGSTFDVGTAPGSLLTSTTTPADAFAAQVPRQAAAVSAPASAVGGNVDQWSARKPFDADVEAQANSYLQRVYSEHDTIPGLVQKMQALRQSSDAREVKVFECIVHNLLDEYKFFPKYPEKELRITGILFGNLIQNLLLPTAESMDMALGYLCEALQKPSEDKMFAFGLCALEQARWRIHEFPQYSSFILQLPAVAKASPDSIATIQGAQLDHVPPQVARSTQQVESSTAGSSSQNASQQVWGSAQPASAPEFGVGSNVDQWSARKPFDADVEAQANSYLQRVYSEHDTIPGLVQKMQALRQSSDAREVKVFECIVHNLLDEYKFFPKYPEKELRITGILFGNLIQNLLLPTAESMDMALGYLCEALQKPSEDKMFAFGLCALEQARWRIHEFPQYSSFILQLPAVAKASPDSIATIQGAQLGQEWTEDGQEWPKDNVFSQFSPAPAPTPTPAPAAWGPTSTSTGGNFWPAGGGSGQGAWQQF